jgi:hypothetical protein
MIALEDRQTMVQDIGAAQSGGARLSKACEVYGIDRRTLHRWKVDAKALQSGDRRPMVIRPTPAHALTPEERARVLRVANEPRFADRPPARIVPRWPMRACIWPASRLSYGCCGRRVRMRTVDAPSNPNSSAPQRPISQAGPVSSGAGI